MKRVAIIAGERSGDARASSLMREIFAADPSVRFFGFGGPQMAAQAEGRIEDWVEQAAVVGLWDVLRHYFWFKKKFDSFLASISKEKPDAVLFVDYPGFNLRMAAAIRRRFPEIRLLYFISPQVWAWNRGRIPKMAKILDLMICIFPFEKLLYEKSGLPTVFCGHPLVEELQADRVLSSADPAPDSRDPNLVGFFPGSRDREIHRLFPVLLQTAKIILRSRPDIHFAAAAASEVQAEWMRGLAEKEGVSCRVETASAHALMQRAGVGLVCSGTASLEAAIYGLPYALIYRVAWLTYEVGKRLVQIPYLGIANILADRLVVKEFIQHDCTPFALADEMLRLLNSPEAREKLSFDLAQISILLGNEGASRRAASAVLSALEKNRRAK